MLKSQSTISGCVWGGGGGRGRGERVGDQLPTFDAKSKNAKILKFNFQGRGAGGLVTNFQLLMLHPKMLKSQSPISRRGGGVGVQLPTFDAESKNVKIPKPHFQEGVSNQL